MIKLLIKFILWRYKPKIIIVCGRIGRSSAKEAIFSCLKNSFRTKENSGKFKGRKDIIFSILGDSFSNFLKNLFFSRNYPEIFVLEIDFSRKENAYFKFLKPDIVVVTALGEIPVQLDFYAGPKDEIYENIVYFLEELPISSNVILNFDDETVREMKGRTKAHCLTFGFQEEADFSASDLKFDFDQFDFEKSGINFKLNFKGNIIPIWLYGTFGKVPIYAALSAAACGLILDLNLVEISQQLREYKNLTEGLVLSKGIKNTFILSEVSDDLLAAAVISALKILQSFELKDGRKIVVLADLIDIDQFIEPVHRTIGEKASEVADFLFCLGTRAKFIADEAKKRNFPKERVFEFDSPEETTKVLEQELKENDLVLITGSPETGIEKILAEIKLKP